MKDWDFWRHWEGLPVCMLTEPDGFAEAFAKHNEQTAREWDNCPDNERAQFALIDRQESRYRSILKRFHVKT